MALKLTKIKSIAIFRALQLGDLLCAVPSFRALRYAYPKAHITLISLPWAKEFTKRFHHYIDEFISFPGFPGLPEQSFDPKKTLQFIKQMHRRRFDVLLQMHGSGDIINPLLQLCGAKYTAGFFSNENYIPNHNTYVSYPNYGSEIKRLLRLIQHLRIPLHGSHLEFPLYPNDYRTYQALHLLLQPHRYVCIHPGARAQDRQWSPAHFAKLGNICTDYGYTVVLTGVATERILAKKVTQKLKKKPVNLVSKTSLGILGVVISQARLLIANDTGVSHLAAALKTPSVIISLSQDTERWTPLNHRLHHVISAT